MLKNRMGKDNDKGGGEEETKTAHLTIDFVFACSNMTLLFISSAPSSQAMVV